MNLSKNFTLDELTASQTAERKGIDNFDPPEEVVQNLEFLCQHLIQKIRDQFGPVYINSGYRCPELNRVIGGSPNSQHQYGFAADLKIPSTDLKKVAKWIIDEGLTFDQLILENYRQLNPQRAWLHVSLTPAINRGEVLHCLFRNGKAFYIKGLP